MTISDRYAENTIGAWDFASDRNHASREVESNWWQYFSDYRLRQWRQELDELTEVTGISHEDICRYLGVTYAKGIGFYEKLPKKRTMYIGIGMALKQPLETINIWLTRFGMKRRLYVKDLNEDLSWMHLINANYRDRVSGRNYYREFDACRQAAHDTYLRCWDEKIEANEQTMLVESDLQNVQWDSGYTGLSRFVMMQMDAFKTAWVKPRSMLNDYVECILRTGRSGQLPYRLTSLNSLRGYLDDSMVNYLSGRIDTVNVIDRRSGRRSLQFKSIPKGKKAHISLALALGMERKEIDRYLTMMGFAALDAVDMEEGFLLNALAVWEGEHPQPRRFMKSYLESGDRQGAAKTREAARAVEQMLHLRQDLSAMYEEWGRDFPYLK